MAHHIRLVEGFPEDALSSLGPLAAKTGSWNEAQVRRQLSSRHSVLSCLAFVGDELVGYKIGYEERPFYFESWIGAVAPEHRRQGIARDLMEAQHQWCREHGYRIVSTVTEGGNAPMLIANLRAGFEVCGTFFDRGKILKVILQRRLD